MGISAHASGGATPAAAPPPAPAAPRTWGQTFSDWGSALLGKQQYDHLSTQVTHAGQAMELMANNPEKAIADVMNATLGNERALNLATGIRDAGYSLADRQRIRDGISYENVARSLGPMTPPPGSAAEGALRFGVGATLGLWDAGEGMANLAEGTTNLVRNLPETIPVMGRAVGDWANRVTAPGPAGDLARQQTLDTARRVLNVVAVPGGVLIDPGTRQAVLDTAHQAFIQPVVDVYHERGLMEAAGYTAFNLMDAVDAAGAVRRMFTKAGTVAKVTDNVGGAIARSADELAGVAPQVAAAPARAAPPLPQVFKHYVTEPFDHLGKMARYVNGASGFPLTKPLMLGPLVAQTFRRGLDSVTSLADNFFPNRLGRATSSTPIAQQVDLLAPGAGRDPRVAKAVGDAGADWTKKLPDGGVVVGSPDDLVHPKPLDPMLATDYGSYPVMRPVDPKKEEILHNLLQNGSDQDIVAYHAAQHYALDPRQIADNATVAHLSGVEPYWKQTEPSLLMDPDRTLPPQRMGLDINGQKTIWEVEAPPPELREALLTQADGGFGDLYSYYRGKLKEVTPTQVSMDAATRDAAYGLTPHTGQVPQMDMQVALRWTEDLPRDWNAVADPGLLTGVSPKPMMTYVVKYGPDGAMEVGRRVPHPVADANPVTRLLLGTDASVAPAYQRFQREIGGQLPALPGGFTPEVSAARTAGRSPDQIAQLTDLMRNAPEQQFSFSIPSTVNQRMDEIERVAKGMNQRVPPESAIELALGVSMVDPKTGQRVIPQAVDHLHIDHQFGLTPTPAPVSRAVADQLLNGAPSADLGEQILEGFKLLEEGKKLTRQGGSPAQRLGAAAGPGLEEVLGVVAPRVDQRSRYVAPGLRPSVSVNPVPGVTDFSTARGIYYGDLPVVGVSSAPDGTRLISTRLLLGGKSIDQQTFERALDQILTSLELALR